MKYTKEKKSLHSWEYTTYASSNLISKEISPHLHPPLNSAKVPITCTKFTPNGHGAQAYQIKESLHKVQLS